MLDAFDRAIGWVVEKPWATTFLLLAITSIACLGYVNPQLVTDLFRESADDSQSTTVAAEVFEAPPDVDPVNLADAHAIVVVQSDDFFTPEGAAALRSVVEQLEALR